MPYTQYTSEGETASEFTRNALLDMEQAFIALQEQTRVLESVARQDQLTGVSRDEIGTLVVNMRVLRKRLLTCATVLAVKYDIRDGHIEKVQS